ncbi:hypothetical protein A2774_02485 [Candidatus Roizmanbacteria bacterium RIFCSPHIGHO2_01_FULL_39_12c]|uniref:Dihydrofolate reductase n=1 Tax=Candidatus Roizmanbacteria bacterium RIFCSPHIGHO2_01_FULL_39_12c TaxID=1802031 RepID=A0A1F7G8L4_9BACT|nr:MAG: hypothetical protein A2774_02485 [Candidatus Roizmanbacteria bacterium RIFCSPHIGHO2_01_FULL_39_12c]OGK47731.1 MAG: hypothetical protein A2963_00475 [Candidatus Roizmanbacteria bacterium RIFCSPLOWO2_01_FULL_40_13]
MIAAISENRVIGKDNKLLWQIPEDLERFKKLTQGHAVIMGRKTFESLPKKHKPLPNRINIIVTRNKKYSNHASINRLIDTIVAGSIEDAITIAKKYEKKSRFAQASRDKEIFIIGGSQIYEQAIKYADKLYLTIVKGKFEGDAYFPDYSEFKKEAVKKESSNEKYQYVFLELDK